MKYVIARKPSRNTSDGTMTPIYYLKQRPICLALLTRKVEEAYLYASKKTAHTDAKSLGERFYVEQID